MKKPALIEKLEWDSDFFGFPIARLNSEILTPSIIDKAMRFCKQEKIRCLYQRATINHPQTVEIAEKHGFHFANFRMSYNFDFDLGHTFPQIRENPFAFRPGKAADVPQLINLSKDLYLDSRYYYDRNFSKAVCNRFYAEWVRKLALGKNKKKEIYVLADKKKIAGYVGFEIVGEEVHLVLVGVAKPYQGVGVGKLLLGYFLKAMFKNGFTKFLVVTQGRNVASQRLYQSMGFKIIESHIDYHKWF